VLLAYAKLDLDAEVLASSLPDDGFFAGLLDGYFPPAAVTAFPEEPGRHRLRREIISTVLINTIVNLAGPVFVLRTREVTGLSSADVARGFVLSDGAFGLSALKARIDALDGKMDARVQIELYGGIADQFRRATRWFLVNEKLDAPIAETVLRYRASLEALHESLALSDGEAAQIQALARTVPQDLARDWVLMRHLDQALDIALLARETAKAPGQVASLYAALGGAIGLDRLRSLAEQYVPAEHWDRLALRRLMDGLSRSQRGIAARLLSADIGVEAWIKTQGPALERTRDFLQALEASGDLSVAKLMLASSQIQNLA
jgi:glutamate dehydrogenase